jgi:hypothetical protein
MKYICDKIILITKFIKLHTYFKTKVVVEFLANFFVVIIIDIHQLNLGPFGSLNYLVKNSLKLCVFFSFISTIKEKYFMYLKKKSIPNERKKYFMIGH